MAFKTGSLFVIAGIVLSYVSGVDATNYTISTIAELTSSIGKIAAGDTIFVKAGTYTVNTTISLSKSGTSSSRCCLMVFPGDKRPVIDFSGMSVGGSNRGITLSGSFWYIKGIRIKGAGDNGMNISGKNNIIEFCDFFENRNSGCQLGGGASDNQLINCDSYFNCDPPDEDDADGFSPKLDVGTGNYFKGCRAWQNSDDGTDGYLRPANKITTTFENCWVFKNGYRKDGSASSGNGNGFKMGGSDSKDLMHNQILKNCLSVGNRVKGFDQNNTKGSMTLYNCTAFNNGINYQMDGTILGSGKALTLINCISAGTGAVKLTGGTITTCNWSGGGSVSNSDFISVDPSSLSAERKTDGSLPDITFMHLQTNPASKLIDAGTVIPDIKYSGSKPDLGCFETGGLTGVLTAARTNESATFSIVSKSSTGVSKVIFDLPKAALTTFSLCDISGRTIADLGTAQFNRGQNEMQIDLSKVAPGNYICRLNYENTSLTQKICESISPINIAEDQLSTFFQTFSNQQVLSLVYQKASGGLE